MKKTVIKMNYSDEKYRAMKKYASDKGVNLDEDIEKFIDKIYEKLVPSMVRDYINSMEEIENKTKNNTLKTKKEDRKNIFIEDKNTNNLNERDVQ